MIYRRVIPIEFNHCDPAGIVFYPRYFEMTNSVIENFFLEVIGYSYARMTMQERSGVPTAKIEANFRAPSRLGERLEFSLRVVRVGGSSVEFALKAECGGQLRLTADLVLVWVEAEGRPRPWPAAIRAPMQAFMEGVEP